MSYTITRCSTENTYMNYIYIVYCLWTSLRDSISATHLPEKKMGDQMTGVTYWWRTLVKKPSAKALIYIINLYYYRFIIRFYPIFGFSHTYIVWIFSLKKRKKFFYLLSLILLYKCKKYCAILKHFRLSVFCNSYRI